MADSGGGTDNINPATGLPWGVMPPPPEYGGYDPLAVGEGGYIATSPPPSPIVAPYTGITGPQPPSLTEGLTQDQLSPEQIADEAAGNQTWTPEQQAQLDAWLASGSGTSTVTPPPPPPSTSTEGDAPPPPPPAYSWPAGEESNPDFAPPPPPPMPPQLDAQSHIAPPNFSGGGRSFGGGGGFSPPGPNNPGNVGGYRPLVPQWARGLQRSLYAQAASQGGMSPFADLGFSPEAPVDPEELRRRQQEAAMMQMPTWMGPV